MPDYWKHYSLDRNVENQLSFDEGVVQANRFIKLVPPERRVYLHRRPRPPRSFKVFEGVDAFDPKYRGMMDQITDQVSKAVKPSNLGSNGWLDGPNQGDFSVLKTQPGVPRWPLSFDRKKKSFVMNPVLKSIIHDVVSTLCRFYIPTPGLVNKESNSGFPLYSSDPEAAHIHASILFKNYRFYCEVYNSDQIDRRALYDKLWITNVSTTQIRLQADTWKDGRVKERPFVGFDELFYKGQPRVKPPDPMYNDRVAKPRTRDVQAPPKVPNINISTILEGFKAYMYRRFPKTFKHRTPDQVASKMSGYKHIVGVDVKRLNP